MLPIFQYSAYIDFAISNIKILNFCTKVFKKSYMYFYYIRYISLIALLNMIFLESKPITYNILFMDKSTLKKDVNKFIKDEKER